ncbi:MAG: presenilin family intramembrane aspartyl protease [Patescibacteria group bacterium]|nr:presenilin family intramembrane aspartyl protease [Patescibacteria group bacterium]
MNFNKKFICFWEAILFVLTLGLGILAVFRLRSFFTLGAVSIPSLNIWQFVWRFFLATLFIFIISILGEKSGKIKDIIFKTIFILAVFSGGSILLNLWMPSIFALILIVVLILIWLIKPTVLVHDLLVILAISSIGAIMGLEFKPLEVILLLLIFSVYDFIAVYKTKHMVKMAKEMIKSRAILGFIIPSNFRDFKENLKKVQPGGNFLILGGGDIIFPLLLCASLAGKGIIDVLIVAVFALTGLLASFLIFSRRSNHQPIPALPPIALFSIIGYLLSLML